jgi:hypothetical protein
MLRSKGRKATAAEGYRFVFVKVIRATISKMMQKFN